MSLSISRFSKWGGSLPALELPHLRWLGVWAPTAFGTLLLAFTLAFHHTLPLWLLVLLVLGASAVGAALFSWFVFAQVQRREEAILRLQETLQELYRVSLAIQEPLELQEQLDRFLQAARDVLHLDRVNILLADSEGQWLQAVASVGVQEPLEALRVPIGQEGGGLAQTYLTQQMIVWDGRAPVPEPLRLRPPYDRIEAFRSRVFANVPLVVQGRAIGVLGADRKHSQQPLEPAMLELFQLFAAQAALAIENARLREGLEARVQTRTRELQAANLRLEKVLKQVEEVSRHKSEFLANMSHELRTPLNSIIGFSELLQDQTFGPLNEKQQRYVTNIHTSGKHLLALINDILDLSKVEAGKLEFRPEAFDLKEALEGNLTIVAAQAAKKGLTLALEVDERLTTLTADPARFKQILYNLLSNAVKFTPEGGRITLKAAVRSEKLEVRGEDNTAPPPFSPLTSHFVEISVADTGIGIKPEDLPKLFQEFTQLGSSFDKPHEGTGLGLALTKKLVEGQGGRIWVESEGEGKGSTFTVLLPLKGYEAKQEIGAPSPARRGWHGSYEIQDNPDC